MEGVGLVTGFQFFTRLAAVLAQEVGHGLAIAIWIENEILFRITLIAWTVSIT